jgi:hypothetical protein
VPEVDEVDAGRDALAGEVDEVDAMRAGDAVAKGADRAKRDEARQSASRSTKRKSFL